MNEGDLLNQRYQLLESLGSGGMAEVYRARDLMLERSVAIKVLRADYSSSQEFRERFGQNARAAANLSHPNIVTVHDFSIHQEPLYIVMEFVPGTDLKSLIRKRGRLTVQESIPLIVQACAGLGYVHRAGLVHCDVKPHNLLITPDMRLKVTNFSIARTLSSIHPGDRVDVVWGSPQYFSPEQAQGLAPSPASDVYSLGVVLYEMLTGVLPFNATTANELAHLHIHKMPIPLREYLPEISPMLEQVEEKILSKEPSARYRTADMLGRVLMQFGAPQEKNHLPADVIRIDKTSHTLRPVVSGSSYQKPNSSSLTSQRDNTNTKDSSSSKMLRVFLCYAFNDKSAVRKIYKFLKDISWIDPWLSDENILPGQNWEIEIHEAIRGADAIIVCLSKKSVLKEGYVQKEIKRALDISDEKPDGAIYIIPLRLDECEVPPRIAKWQWVDYFDTTAKERLLKSLRARAEGLNIVEPFF